MNAAELFDGYTAYTTPEDLLVSADTETKNTTQFTTFDMPNTTQFTTVVPD
jgi:hypothetical protein